MHKLKVLERQARSRNHGVAVARASVRAGGGEVGAPIASRSQDGLVGLEAMQGAVLHAQGQDATAGAVLVHDEVQGKVLDCANIMSVHVRVNNKSELAVFKMKGEGARQAGILHVLMHWLSLELCRQSNHTAQLLHPPKNCTSCFMAWPYRAWSMAWPVLSAAHAQRYAWERGGSGRGGGSGTGKEKEGGRGEVAKQP